MSSPKYDDQGGIVSLEHDFPQAQNAKSQKKSFSFLEKLMIKKSKRLNYLLDENNKYKCRSEKTPSVIRIGPTNRCTAQCFYCPREHIHENGSGYMDMVMFNKILDYAKINNIKNISFALFGEPLIHPNIFEMLSLVKGAGIEARISTNAIVMSKEMAMRLIDLKLESIEMSLDGFDENEYLEGKRVAKYNQAKENIEYLLEIAKEKKSDTTFNIHFVDAGNVSLTGKRNFVKYWKDKLNGLKYVTSFYYEPHNWAGTRENMSVKKRGIDKLLSKFDLKKPCVYVQGLNIDWNGNVLICTNDPTKKAVLGNINEQSFEEIYNGEIRMNYLSAHEKGDFRELNCSVCTVNSYWPLLFIKKRVVNFFSR